jgi:prepilin-type N-terminal cleavage/methylation domain-containing protein
MTCTLNGKRFSRGFTLLEIILASGILVIVLSGSFLIFSKFGKTHSLTTSSEKVISVLQEARSKTISSQSGSSFGVLFGEEVVTLFQSPYVENHPANKKIQLVGPVKISGINLNGGGAEVVFSRIFGETNQSGSVTVSLKDNSSSMTIIIQSTGNVYITE